MDHPWTPSDDDRALAAILGPGSAFLPLDGSWAHVTGPTAPGRSPVLDLVQAIWELDPRLAHLALRRRIRTTDPVTPADRAICDVAAKRVCRVDGAPGNPLTSVDLGPYAARARERAAAASISVGARFVPPDPAAWVASLVPAGDDLPLARRDRPVVAVLAGPDGTILHAARNAGGANRTLHAEVCLVQGHGALPAGATVYTSLQPCRMCAAILVDAAKGPISVRYLEPDPGRLATRTALQDRHWEQRMAAIGC